MRKMLAKIALIAVVAGGFTGLSVESASATPPKAAKCYTSWQEDVVLYVYTYRLYTQTLRSCTYIKWRYNTITRSNTRLGYVTVQRPGINV